MVVALFVSGGALPGDPLVIQRRLGVNRDEEEGFCMDQMTLFPLEAAPAKESASDCVPIRSGRVGPIRFGASEASYAMTQAVLVALAAPDGPAAEASDR